MLIWHHGSNGGRQNASMNPDSATAFFAFDPPFAPKVYRAVGKVHIAPAEAQDGLFAPPGIKEMASKMNKVKCSRAPARLAAHKSRATSGRVSHTSRGSGFSGRQTGAPRVSQLSLIRTFAAQTEALQRYRGKGQQKVTVEHVHVHTGGQAIVGAVSQPGGGGKMTKTEDNPMHPKPGEP